MFQPGTITTRDYTGHCLQCCIDGRRVFFMHKSQHKAFYRKVQELRDKQERIDTAQKAACIIATFAAIARRAAAEPVVEPVDSGSITLSAEKRDFILDEIADMKQQVAATQDLLRKVIPIINPVSV